jgi:hypothetical protein
VAKKLPDIIAAVNDLIDTANSRFASSTIEYEAIAAFGTPIVAIHAPLCPRTHDKLVLTLTS